MSFLVCYACNIKFPCSSSIHRVFGKFGIFYNDATSVLYTARLVNSAFCIQLMVR